VQRKIFSAIERLDGGFAQLNENVQLALRRWLANAGVTALERTDPYKADMSVAELAEEAMRHGRVDACMTKVLTEDRSP
jgi:hypothetical protein